MRLEIIQQPQGLHFVTIDGFGRVLDLSAVNGTLHDPTLARVTWGEGRELGVIYRRLGPPQAFFDRDLLRPYIDAFEADKAAE